MNTYRYVFACKCPSDDETIIYGLEVRAVERIMVEQIKEACAEWPQGYQEDIAADLVKQLGGEVTLRAQHQGVEIVTVLGSATPQAGTTAPSEREAFEAWIRKDAGDLSTFGSGQNLHYRNSAVNNAWGGWERRAALTRPTTVQQAEVLTEDQIREGFRDYDTDLVARHRTPWQIWRDSSVWTQVALKGMQPVERKDGLGAQQDGKESGNG